MMNKVFFGLLLNFLAATFSVVEGNQTGRVLHVAFLGNAPKERIDAFRRRLRELGWVEDVTIVIHYRPRPFGKNDLNLIHAADLVQRKVDVIVTAATEAALAAQQATKTIPIVMAGGSDPVEWGLVESLSRPGGNITGVRTLSAELGGKRLELLREAFPQLSRVAILSSPGARGQQAQMKVVKAAAHLLQLELEPVGVDRPDDYQNAFAVMKRQRVGAFISLSMPQFSIERGRIVSLAQSHKLPAIYPGPEFTEAGGLMSYGPDRPEMFRRAAVYVDKILRGAKPAELPVEQPTKFEFVINFKAAKQIGVTIPPQVLMDADKVIK